MVCSTENRLLFFWLVFLGCFCCFTLAAATSQEDFLKRLKRQAEAEPGNANEFLDELLENSRKELKDRGLDPLQIGKIEICSDCVISGLTTIKRIGDSTIRQDDNDIVVDLKVGFDLLRGSCYCVKKLLLVSVRGIIQFILKDLGIHMTVRVVVTPSADIEPSVDAFEVINPGRLDIYFDGRGVLGNIVQPFFNLFRGRIARAVQRLMPAVLKTAVVKNIHRVKDFIPIF